jgi:superoxide dismutase
MPWDELKPRQFPAFDKELDGISRQTMEDHYKLYEGYAKKANECRKRLNEFDYSQIEGNQVYSDPRAVSIDYTFALLGYKNHDRSTSDTSAVTAAPRTAASPRSPRRSSTASASGSTR